MTDARQIYLEVTLEAGREFFIRGRTGPVTMLNLLRFLELADYSQSPELASSEPISGGDRRFPDIAARRELLHNASLTPARLSS